MVNLLNRLQPKAPAHDHACGHDHGDSQAHAAHESYSGYQEPDTKVPPKAQPLFRSIRVNGVEIAEHLILAEAQNHPAENPGEALEHAARALVIRQLLLSRAEELALLGTPTLDEDGRRETDEDAAIRAVIEQEARAPIASEEECRRYFDNNRQRFASEPLWEACHILISADPGNRAARETAKKTAEGLIATLRQKPGAFSSLAAEFSACPSGQQGGNLGQLSPGSTVPEFEAALDRLSAGEIVAAPVESRYGFHIIRLDRKIDAQPLPFEMVRETIAGWLEAAAWSKSVSQYIGLLAAGAEIEGIDLLAGRGMM
jgi:peptidyl-prolyl cis-trans isomerase C